jgi:uncharacterized protein (DUF2236 family)
VDHGPVQLRPGRPLARVRAFLPGPLDPGTPGDPGLFGPGTAAWRIGRERALLLAGPAALLLQVAHPLVGAGVAAHSDFTADPLRRLRGTLEAVLTVTFGDSGQAHEAARRVGRRHALVRGSLAEPVGRLPAGTPYSARDAAPAQWVWATLAWSALRATASVVRPVPPAERDAYVHDMLVFGHLFGVPADAPADADALEAYVQDQLDGTLEVGPTARALADRILDPQPPLLPRPLRRAPTLLAAALLPAAVRDAYGLPWRRRERAAWAVLRVALRTGVRVLPSALREWPHARAARERVGDRQVRRGTPLSASGTSEPRTGA